MLTSSLKKTSVIFTTKCHTETADGGLIPIRFRQIYATTSAHYKKKTFLEQMMETGKKLYLKTTNNLQQSGVQCFKNTNHQTKECIQGHSGEPDTQFVIVSASPDPSANPSVQFFHSSTAEFKICFCCCCLLTSDDNNCAAPRWTSSA